MNREVLERYCESRGLMHVQAADSFVILFRYRDSREAVINDIRRMDNDSNKKHRIWVMSTGDVVINDIYEREFPF